jgi:hypothetical protein
MLRGMRGEILSDGKFVKAKDIPRGSSVLKTSEEWHQRVLSINRKNWPLAMAIHPLIVYPIWMTLRLFIGNEPLSHTFIRATVYWVTYAVLYHAMEVYQSNREVVRQNHSGLFEYGIQMRLAQTHVCLFVPYSEIIDFRVKNGWFWQTLTLEIRGMKKPFSMQGMPEILGNIGLKELRRRVDTNRGVVEMPKLVLYGDRSTATMSRAPLGDLAPRVPVYSTRLQF